jgi:hypothetical protein
MKRLDIIGGVICDDLADFISNYDLADTDYRVVYVSYIFIIIFSNSLGASYFFFAK